MVYWCAPNCDRRLLIPPCLQDKLVQALHRDTMVGGHLGITKKPRKVASLYAWKGQKETVERVLMACPSCQAHKQHRQVPLESDVIPPVPIRAHRVLELWGVDAVGPLPETESGFKFVADFVEYLSMYTVASPLRSLSS